MQKRSIFLALSALVLSSSFVAQEVRASSMTLAALEAGGTLSIGGLTFSNFALDTSVLVGTGPANNPANITVSTFSIGIEKGIKFSAFSAPSGSTIDYAISYDVTAAPGIKINDAFASSAFNIQAGGGASIDEQIFSTSAVDLLTFTLDPTHKSFGPTFFAPQSSIVVLKDILITGGTTGADSGISNVNQLYSTTVAVPEPASVSMFGIGLLGLVAFRRRYRRALAV